MALVKSKILTQDKMWCVNTWKISFRSKLLEICQLRTKKSSPYMFNFYVTLAGHDIITDTGRAITCRRKIQSPIITNKSTKKWRSFRKHGFYGKTVWILQTKKKQKQHSRLFKKPQWDTSSLELSTEYRSCNQ